MEQQKLTVSAPGDVTVQKLFVTNGKVKAGDTLATLSSIQLDRYKASFDKQVGALAIEERPFSDGRVDKLLQLTKDEAAAAQAALKVVQDWEQGARVAFAIDPSSPQALTLPTVLIELQDRTAELATINNELDELPKSSQDAKDRLDLAKQQLAIQKTALDALSALLTVVAPADGVFVASVGMGGFVKRGDALGVLSL